MKACGTCSRPARYCQSDCGVAVPRGGNSCVALTASVSTLRDVQDRMRYRRHKVDHYVSVHPMMMFCTGDGCGNDRYTRVCPMRRARFLPHALVIAGFAFDQCYSML